MRMLLFTVGLALSAPAHAQTWSELQAVPKETSVRVFEMAGKGWTFADGKLLLVKDEELAILRNRRPIVIPKAVIARVETRRRDLPVEGAVLGALATTALGLLGGWQGCSSGSSCVVAGIATGRWIGRAHGLEDIDPTHRISGTVITDARRFAR